VKAHTLQHFFLTSLLHSSRDPNHLLQTALVFCHVLFSIDGNKSLLGSTARSITHYGVVCQGRRCLAPPFPRGDFTQGAHLRNVTAQRSGCPVVPFAGSHSFPSFTVATEHSRTPGYHFVDARLSSDSPPKGFKYPVHTWHAFHLFSFSHRLS